MVLNMVMKDEEKIFLKSDVKKKCLFFCLVGCETEEKVQRGPLKKEAKPGSGEISVWEV